ncbi:hypothetical protein BKA70DRAFT_1540552 [Coprinopsis sp. MPI-PUGE-AT-0042]|nr:hypothetical protein BKA70DRAFT_1540552 [Coprinopsis sp. MPI-PUGE-AT-0042]
MFPIYCKATSKIDNALVKTSSTSFAYALPLHPGPLPLIAFPHPLSLPDQQGHQAVKNERFCWLEPSIPPVLKSDGGRTSRWGTGRFWLSSSVIPTKAQCSCSPLFVICVEQKSLWGHTYNLPSTHQQTIVLKFAQILPSPIPRLKPTSQAMRVKEKINASAMCPEWALRCSKQGCRSPRNEDVKQATKEDPGNLSRKPGRANKYGRSTAEFAVTEGQKGFWFAGGALSDG